MTKKEQILQLRNQGMTYSQIAREVDVTNAYVSLVCNPAYYRRQIKANTLRTAKRNLIKRLRQLLEQDPSFSKEVIRVARGGDNE